MGTKSQQVQIRLAPEQKSALKRLARETGQSVSAYVLSRALPAARERFGDLVQALRDREGRRFVLADLNDFLTKLASVEFSDAVADAVAVAKLVGLSPYMQNYVAAMVEQAAHQKGVAAPAWINEIEALEEPRFAAPLSSLRLHLLRASPVPFKRRLIFVDSSVGDRV